jgi:hypothetical protein
MGRPKRVWGKSAMAHQGVADSRYVIFLGPVGLHGDRVAEQVADADSKGGGEFAHNVEPSEVALVPLYLAQPVLRSSDQAGENALGHPATAAVESDPFADRTPRPLGRVGLGLLDVYPYMDQSR